MFVQFQSTLFVPGLPILLGHYNEITCFSSASYRKTYAGGRVILLFINVSNTEVKNVLHLYKSSNNLLFYFRLLMAAMLLSAYRTI